jgi:hypothetical protein
METWRSDKLRLALQFASTESLDSGDILFSLALPRLSGALKRRCAGTQDTLLSLKYCDLPESKQSWYTYIRNTRKKVNWHTLETIRPPNSQNGALGKKPCRSDSCLWPTSFLSADRPTHQSIYTYRAHRLTNLSVKVRFVVSSEQQLAVVPTP